MRSTWAMRCQGSDGVAAGQELRAGPGPALGLLDAAGAEPSRQQLTSIEWKPELVWQLAVKAYLGDIRAGPASAWRCCDRASLPWFNSPRHFLGFPHTPTYRTTSVVG